MVELNISLEQEQSNIKINEFVYKLSRFARKSPLLKLIRINVANLGVFPSSVVNFLDVI